MATTWASHSVRRLTNVCEKPLSPLGIEAHEADVLAGVLGDRRRAQARLEAHDRAEDDEASDGKKGQEVAVENQGSQEQDSQRKEEHPPGAEEEDSSQPPPVAEAPQAGRRHDGEHEVADGRPPDPSVRQGSLGRPPEIRDPPEDASGAARVDRWNGRTAPSPLPETKSPAKTHVVPAALARHDDVSGLSAGFHFWVVFRLRVGAGSGSNLWGGGVLGLGGWWAGLLKTPLFPRIQGEFPCFSQGRRAQWSKQMMRLIWPYYW